MSFHISDYMDEMLEDAVEGMEFDSKSDLEKMLDSIVDDVADEAAKVARGILAMTAEELLDTYNVRIADELEEDEDE